MFFAGYKLPHPLVQDMIVKVQTKDSPASPVIAMRTAIKDLQDEFSTLGELFNVRRRTARRTARRSRADCSRADCSRACVPACTTVRLTGCAPLLLRTGDAQTNLAAFKEKQQEGQMYD